MLDRDTIPVVLPHYVRRDAAVYFLASRRPVLTLAGSEVDLFDAIDGRAAVRELEHHPAAHERLAAWHAAGIVRTVPPRAAPSVRSHLLVIEPHMDDAILSVGGRLLKRAGTQRITILSVVRWSNFTTYLYGGEVDFSDTATVTELRTAESRLAARMLGAEHRHLEERDVPLTALERYPRALSPAQGGALTLCCLSFLPDREQVARVAAQLAHALSTLEVDEVWIPMGIGDHPDHILAREASLRALAGRAGVDASMYEDVPYCYDNSRQAMAIAGQLAACGGKVTPAPEDISDVFERKLELCAVYASQWKMAQMEQRILRCAESRERASGQWVEMCYRIDHLPATRPDPRRSCIAADALARLRERLEAWRAERVSHIAIASMAPFGDWRRGMEALLAAFPDASFSVRVPAFLAWEVASFTHPRVSVEPAELTPAGRDALLASWRADGVPVLVLDPYGSTAVDHPLRQIVARSLGDVSGALAEW